MSVVTFISALDHRPFLSAISAQNEAEEEKPDLPSPEILRRVREAGDPGGKTAHMLWWLRCDQKEKSPWSVLKVCQGN